MIASEPLHHFVDDYLSFLYETNPSAATFDGVHLHDDLLESFDRASVERNVQSLAGLARRLAAISTDSLTAVERVERPWIAAHIQGRMHELEKIRTWERNPQMYGELLGVSLAGQALFDYAPAEDRARRVLSKLRQTPRFIQSARDNIKDPPGIFVKNGLETLRGTLRFIEADLPKAFADVDDLGLLGDLADAQAEAIDALKSYAAYLEADLAPKARASFRLGADRFSAKLRFEEGMEIPLDRLLEIGLRELNEAQEEFRAAAGRVEPGDPLEVWRRVKDRHAPVGGIVNAARDQLTRLATFIARRDLVSLPSGEQVIVAPTPDFFRWSFASMWTPGPFETKTTRAYYYLTDVDPAWPPERKQDHLRDLNTPTLWSISMHEA